MYGLQLEPINQLQNVRGIYFTERDMLNVWKAWSKRSAPTFFHLSSEKLFNLFKCANLSKAIGRVKIKMDEVSQSRLQCEEHSTKHYFFKVCIPPKRSIIQSWIGYRSTLAWQSTGFTCGLYPHSFWRCHIHCYNVSHRPIASIHAVLSHCIYK